MIHIPEHVAPCYQAAIAELDNPEIAYTNIIKTRVGFKMVDNHYCCDRFVKQEISYLFYFKVNTGNYYYRILVMEEDAMVYSARIVNSNLGSLLIKNEHNGIPFQRWMGYFDQTAVWEQNPNHLRLIINEIGAYEIHEIIENLISKIKKHTEREFRDYSLENQCCLEIKSYVSKDALEAIEIEKWCIHDLSLFNFSLQITQVLE